MPNERYCVNCKWHHNSRCHEPRNDIQTEISRVSGEPTARTAWWPSCTYERTLPWIAAIFFGTCGKSGRRFQPKETPDAP